MNSQHRLHRSYQVVCHRLFDVEDINGKCSSFYCHDGGCVFTVVLGGVRLKELLEQLNNIHVYRKSGNFRVRKLSYDKFLC